MDVSQTLKLLRNRIRSGAMHRPGGVRGSVYSAAGNMYSANDVDEVSEQRDIFVFSDTAPHVPLAGTPTEPGTS